VPRSEPRDATRRSSRPAPTAAHDLLARAPAKVNLVLRVGPRRPDGYHDIDSLFAPLDLCDRVRVRVSTRRGKVTCRAPGRPDLDGPGNLAARAAEGFRARFGVDRGVDVTVEKRIPVTAGLGGGSSDAAAVLRCLARAFGVRDRRALAEVALAIGSDVPFFLGRGPARGAGRGEKLVPEEVPALHLVLVHPADPALAIRAGEAYRWLDEARAREGGARRGRARADPSGSEASVRRPFRPDRAWNDLEAPCLERRPALVSIRGALVGAGAVSAIMSGSGPTVFGIFASRRAARRAAVVLRESAAQGLDVYLARTLRRQPGVTRWRSPRSASSRSTRTSSRPT
jgi:4-diphosphocytidyl-2-C-methyl-D-erythritol kinase